MKIKLYLIVINFFLLLIFLPKFTFALSPDPGLSSTSAIVVPCGSGCTIEQKNMGLNCVTTYEEWLANPLDNHFWVVDPDVTNQGKADERARQFIYWTLQNNSIDSHPVLMEIWKSTRNITYFLLIVVAAIMGVGMIVAQRTNFATKIQVWPSIVKLFMLLLYIAFSAAIVLTVIQISEVLMKFFIENLGGKNLFNIYFAGASQESNYGMSFCRDLNWHSQEAVKTELLMLKLTNITYYVMGAVLILRKIILWFMLFVAPFLALLLPFTFIRNIGLIWIGVFFQWVFYGPLFSLFLGALAKIWKAGIPYLFDFSRAGKPEGYIYPSGTNILYGGPAQTLTFLNSANYIDTFAEYIITLIMLWAVIVFPWFLLRIFRNYCCDAISAMKNVIISFYDQIRGGFPQGSKLSPFLSPSLRSTLKIPKEIEIPVKLKLETIEDIKKINTEDISKSLNLKISKLTDLAHIETISENLESARRNLEYLGNPNKAETPNERQKYMNIRTELFSRAVKDDKLAKQILSTISASQVGRIQNRDEIIKTMPQTVPITRVVSVKVKIPQEKISSLNRAFVSAVSSNNNLLTSISESTQLPVSQVKTVLIAYQQAVTPSEAMINNISQETGLSKDKVLKVVRSIVEIVKTDTELIKQVAKLENVKEEDVKRVVQAQIPLLTEPEKNIEQTIAIPPTISIEEYEGVKKMWMAHYEKGEVPVSSHIRNRQEWVEKDVVFISNTLNKLLSYDNKLKDEGLDNLGYILPIFIINNLKGEEMAVYLKAKLEAAKAVQEQFVKEKESKEKLEKTKDEEELVDVDRSKKEEQEKTMEMSKEIDQKTQEQETKDQNKN